MKIRSLILILATVAVTTTSLTGCVVVPARGYVVAPAPAPVVVYHGYARW